MSVAIVVTGAVVGVIVGLTSTGGGAFLTPALVLVAGVPPALAVGSDLLVASAMKLVGGVAYAAKQQVHWGTVARLASGSIPGAVLGVLILDGLSPAILDLLITRSLGLVLVLAGLATLVRLLARRHELPTREPTWASTAAIGLVIGLLVSVTSVGSGSLLIVMLGLFYPLRAQDLVGTDLAHAAVLTASAALAHLVSGRVDWVLSGTVLVGGLPGVLAGVKLAQVLPERALRGGLAVALVSLGGYLSLVSHRPLLAAAEVRP